MPHIILEGPLDLHRLARELGPLSARDEAGIRRTGEIFINTRGRRVLIEATVIAAARAQRFYVSVAHQGKGASPGAVVVRLEQLTDPIKNEGVRRLLVEIARAIQALFPGVALGRTNLQAYLDRA